MNNKLLMRNNDSREKTEFICPSERREFQRCRSKPNDTMNVTPINVKKRGPIADWAKACTEESTPERVRKVPKMTREYVRMIRIIFHRLNMPFLSWIMTECRKAVPVNQGMNDAISTGFKRLWDGTVPFLLWNPTATTSMFLSGFMGVTQGAG